MIFQFGLSLRPQLQKRHLVRGPCYIAARSAYQLWNGIIFNKIQRWLATTANESGQAEQSVAQRTQKGKPKRRNVNYTYDEDALIVSLRSRRVGWSGIQSSLPSRTINSLRHRWEHHLRPNKDFEFERLKGPYTSADTAKIKRLRTAGTPWKQIQEEHFLNAKHKRLLFTLPM